MSWVPRLLLGLLSFIQIHSIKVLTNMNGLSHIFDSGLCSHCGVQDTAATSGQDCVGRCQPTQFSSGKSPYQYYEPSCPPGDDSDSSSSSGEPDSDGEAGLFVSCTAGDIQEFLFASGYVDPEQQISVLRSLASFLAAKIRPADKFRADKGRKRVKKVL